MTKSIVIGVLIIVASALNAVAADLKYFDARQFPLLGTAAPNQARNSYVRLPDSLKGKIPESLWSLGNNSAGMSIRFASDATQIGVKFKTATRFEMNHMTYTGIHGADLYVLADNGKWEFVGAARPAMSKNDVKVTIMSNMKKKQREYMLFLPLYDGLDSLYVGVDSLSEVVQPQLVISRHRPVVTYGTSVTQGGCATRPGMVHTNIIQRELNREVINLGFSGNGQLHAEVAEVMASVEAGIYIIDCLPNCTSKTLQERLLPFVEILRKARPEVPILFLESPYFPLTRLDAEVNKTITEKNATYKQLFNQLKAKGEKNIYYLDGHRILEDNWDYTIDNYHFTDLGFTHFAKVLIPLIKKYSIK